MGVIGLDHVAVQVADVDRSSRFYQKHLGFIETRRASENATYVQDVVGHAGCTLEMAFLTIPGTSQFLEIIEYRDAPRQAVDPDTANPGTGHFCVVVDDLEALYKRLRSVGVEFVSAPATPTSGPNAGGRVVYMKDPDGIRVELVELADGKAGMMTAPREGQSGR